MIDGGQDQATDGPSITCPYCTALVRHGDEANACEHFGGWTLSEAQGEAAKVVGAQFTNLYSHESEYVEIVPPQSTLL